MIKSPFKSNLNTLVIIDGHHLNTLARKNNMNIEFKVLRELLSQSPLLGSPKYYTATLVDADGEPKNNLAALISWLSFNGYDTITQNVYQINNDSRDYNKYSISHINMHMCLDILTLYYEQSFGRLLLISGNREIVPIIQRMRKLGVQIDIISSLDFEAVPPEIRSNCDYFYEFTEIADQFNKV